MNYIVAVSGGVDSVVLLNMLVSQQQQGPTLLQGWTLQRGDGLIVAHFDHGIRPESVADARFVEELAKYYGLPCEVRREELGLNASEAHARERRYTFLREMAEKYNATIVTAHHQDDLIETIAINFLRGTGWRGLAVFGNSAITRPLLGQTKNDLYEYALKHSLEWVEDETNRTDAYLRNRIRSKCRQLDQTLVEALKKLWESQSEIRRSVDEESNTFIEKKCTSRYFFICQPESTALEILRTVTNQKLTRPRLRALLLAIKTAQPHSTYEAGSSVTVRFSTTEFIVDTP